MSLEQNVSQIFQPYFNDLSSLNESLRQHGTKIEFYTLKSNQANTEIEKKLNQLNQEEIELSKKFITNVEKEEFYINPPSKYQQLVTNAKKHKNDYIKRKGKYTKQIKQVEKKEKELEEKVNQLDNEKQELYKLLCDLILNEGEDNCLNQYEEELIQNNSDFIKSIKAKCSNLKKQYNNYDYTLGIKENKGNARSLSETNTNGKVNNYSKMNKRKNRNISSHNKKHALRNKNKSSQSPCKSYHVSNYSISSSQISITSNATNLSTRKKHINHRKQYSSSSDRRPIKNNSYSNMPTHLSNQNDNNSLIAGGNKECDNIKYTNKSYYLLRNARREKSLQHHTNIRNEDLGGEHCCYKLLRNYKDELSDDSHFLFKSSSNPVTKARSASRCRNNRNRSFSNENRSLVKERMENKLMNNPKLCIKGRIVHQNVIGKATDSENGINLK